MKLGITGTQKGMTEKQKTVFARTVSFLNPEEANLGDCIGVDTEAYEIIKRVVPNCKTIGHIPLNDSKRGFCEYDSENEPLSYMDRNQTIVDSSDYVIGITAEDTEQLRSGTWSTLRKAEKAAIDCCVLKPSGQFEKFKGKDVWKNKA